MIENKWLKNNCHLRWTLAPKRETNDRRQTSITEVRTTAANWLEVEGDLSLHHLMNMMVSLLHTTVSRCCSTTHWFQQGLENLQKMNVSASKRCSNHKDKWTVKLNYRHSNNYNTISLSPDSHNTKCVCVCFLRIMSQTMAKTSIYLGCVQAVRSLTGQLLLSTLLWNHSVCMWGVVVVVVVG